MPQDVQSSNLQSIQTLTDNSDIAAHGEGIAQQETASDKLSATPTKIEHFVAQKTALELFVAENAEKVQDPTSDVSARLDPQLKQRLDQSSVPAEVKESIINHFNSLDTERAKQHAKLLKLALDGDGENADRAIMAFDRIMKIPDEQQRLTEGIKSTLIQGVAQRAMPTKTENGVDQSTGQAGLLGVVHAQRAAEAITKMDDKRYQSLTNALDQAGGVRADGKQARAGADTQAEQALILKAVGARGIELSDPKSAAGAMKEVTDFAGKIRGMERSDLLNRTASIDIDVNRSTSDIRSTQWDPNMSKPLELQLGDNTSSDPYKNDNDTLTQRGKTYCAPTVSQIVRGYADPVSAFERSADANNVTATSETAKQQKKIFDRYGGDEKAGGIAAENVPEVLKDLAQAGVEYRYNNAKIRPMDHEYGLNRSFLIDKQFQKIDSLLRNGQTVPIAVQGSMTAEGHVMLITDVRGSGDSKRYLVSDPASGRTTWVSSEAMRERRMPNWMTVDKFPGYGLSENKVQMRVHIQGFYEEVAASK